MMSAYLAAATIFVASLALGHIVRSMLAGQLTDRRLIISSALTVLAGLLLLASYLT